MKIGILDSGIGGVSVLHEALRRLPDEEYIFYADVDHVPYGLKKPEEIRGYVDHIVKTLISMDVSAIVIACNTATAVAADYVRGKYNIPIIGMEPAVKPAVKMAEGSEGRVLVMATPVTIRENKLHNLILKVDKAHKVDLLPMPDFVKYAERGIFDAPEVDDYIAEQLKDYDSSVYTEVVLGCTHFNYFKPAIKKAFRPDTIIMDGNEGTVNHLAEVLGLEKTIDKVKYEGVIYLESGRIVPEEIVQTKYDTLHKRLEYVYEY